MTRLQDRMGKIGQEQAARALFRLGVLCIEKIGTPVKLRPARQKGAFMVTYGEKVSGDHHGLLPGGRGVLVETKHDEGNSLAWSRLRPHQPGKLTEWAKAGGVSLLIWASSRGVFVMQWPIEGFGPGKGISLAQAAELDIQSLDDLQ